MTDYTPTPRAAWTRCSGCQQKVENDRHEINIHKLICPHRLQLQIQDLTRQVNDLKREVQNLDEQFVEPDVDPNAVAPWPDDEDDEDEPEDDIPAAGLAITPGIIA